MITKDKTKFDYWESIKLGELIQLEDEQTIEYLMEQGCDNLTHGADFVVKRKRVITEQVDLGARFLILDIELKNFLWYLVVKSTSGSDCDTMIYYIPEGVEDGDRRDMLEKNDWLFEDISEDIEVKDLEFSKTIIQDDDISFTTNGATYGECVEGGDRSFATVVEYSTDKEDVENPLFLILEFNNIKAWETTEEITTEDEDGYDEVVGEVKEGGVDIDEENSYVTFYQGCRINLNDVSILR